MVACSVTLRRRDNVEQEDYDRGSSRSFTA